MTIVIIGFLCYNSGIIDNILKTDAQDIFVYGFLVTALLRFSDIFYYVSHGYDRVAPISTNCQS